MAYSRHTWASGDVVSAARLNNIEDGIEGGFLAKHTGTWNGNVLTLDASWNDLLAEINAGKLPYLYGNQNWPFFMLVNFYCEDNYYLAEFQNATLTASDPDDPLNCEEIAS